MTLNCFTVPVCAIVRDDVKLYHQRLARGVAKLFTLHTLLFFVAMCGLSLVRNYSKLPYCARMRKCPE